MKDKNIAYQTKGPKMKVYAEWQMKLKVMSEVIGTKNWNKEYINAETQRRLLDQGRRYEQAVKEFEKFQKTKRVTKENE